MKNKNIVFLIVLTIGVLSISASAIFVKLTTAPSAVTAFYRMFFSVILLMPIFLIKYRREVFEISKKDWVFCFFAGVFLSFHFILWFESLNYTSVASSTVLVTMQPLFAFIGTYLFFKERYSFRSIICVCIAAIGCMIIAWGDLAISDSSMLGNMLALIACALATAYFLFGQSVRKRVSLITYTFTIYAISSVTLLLYIFITNEDMFNYESRDWIIFILLAIVPNLLGHSLFNWILKWLSTTVISMAILFEPVGAAILAFIFLEERIVWTQLLGGSIVLISIIYFLTINKK